MLSSQFVLAVIRFAFGAVFVLAGISKLPKQAQFHRALAAYELLPQTSVQLVGIVLPGLEIGLGILLVVGVWISPAAIGVGLLLGIFALGMAINIVRGRRLDCGCFGPLAPRRMSWPVVWRNLIAASFAFYLALSSRASVVPGWSALRLEISSLIVATVALLIATLLRSAGRLRAQSSAMWAVLMLEN